MKIDFQFNGKRYMLNFEDPILKDSVFSFELRSYYSLEPDSNYASSLKRIENNKIVWGAWDYGFISKEAQEHCDRLIRNKAFL